MADQREIERLGCALAEERELVRALQESLRCAAHLASSGATNDAAAVQKRPATSATLVASRAQDVALTSLRNELKIADAERCAVKAETDSERVLLSAVRATVQTERMARAHAEAEAASAQREVERLTVQLAQASEETAAAKAAARDAEADKRRVASTALREREAAAKEMAVAVEGRRLAIANEEAATRARDGTAVELATVQQALERTKELSRATEAALHEEVRGVDRTHQRWAFCDPRAHSPALGPM